MYQLKKTCGAARRGEFPTPHGVIQMPAFLNVATAGAIKGAVSALDLKNLKCQVQLCNTYHLHLRPGDENVKTLGGLHRFTRWDGPILTDSGGFQVFSLAKLRNIREEGVFFSSHIDGRKIFMGPEESMRIQSHLASTIAMAFDECIAKDYPAFEGLHGVLDELVARGRRLAVATSRLESRAKTMMEELAFTQFDVAYGLNPPARMTKADAVRDTLAALGGDATNALMVGDSHFDVEGAAAFGIPCIGVTYGGTSTEDELMAAGAVAVAHTVEELRAMLLGSTERAGMLRYHA